MAALPQMLCHLNNLLYCYCPSLLVLGQAHLNGCQSRVQLLRHRARARSELIPETQEKNSVDLNMFIHVSS